MSKHGSKIPKVQPIFPSEDYPVWSSIATGQYSDGHHIIGDVMYNLHKSKWFDRFDKNTTRDQDWWLGMEEPFWVTAMEEGRRVRKDPETML